jgi:hypothetical protein
MAIASAVQGESGIYQEFIFTDASGNAVNLTGYLSLSGRMRNITFGTEKAITGGLTVTAASSGLIRWTYSTADVDTAGTYLVQISVTFSGGSIKRTAPLEFHIIRQFGGAFSSLLTRDYYDQVRTAIDTSLDANILTDEVIAMPTFHGAAEAFVYERDPDAATRTGAELVHIINAIVFLTAAYLVPSIPFLLREDFGDYNYSRFLEKNFVDELVASLRSRANAELNIVLGLDLYASMPVMFDVAPGRRGV